MTVPSRVLFRGAGGFTGRAWAGTFQARMHDGYGLGQKQSNDADTLSCAVVVGGLIDKKIGRSRKILMPS